MQTPLYEALAVGACAAVGTVVGLLAASIPGLADAFRGTKTRFCLISFSSDWLYPTYHSKELVSALTAVGADVSYCNLQSTWGHDAFLLEVDTMTGLISNFLDRVVTQYHIDLPR